MKKKTCKKVFISSTCFDLKDLRAELAISLKEWGYTKLHTGRWEQFVIVLMRE